MKWIAARVTFDSPDPDLAADLIADIFYALGLKGVVVEGTVMDPAQDWGEDAVRPPEKPAVIGYFGDTRGAADRCRNLEASLERLGHAAAIQSRVAYTRIDEQDWAEAWKEYFWPVKITANIVVKPSWREYAAGPEEVVLEIDPGMAFGTGTHPTTALCIRLLQNHLRAGDSFLDVGTGSGILMIAAAKLGAAFVSGIDNDEMAVGVAGKNLQANGIDDRRFHLATGHLVTGLCQTFDVVVANILAEVVLGLLPDVASVLSGGGIFICSGIIAAKKDDVRLALQAGGYHVIEVLEKEGWVAIAANRKEGPCPTTGT
ncbi:MAG TPA: 50S ribosomal protein L11 methyltransferase [Desulfosarcina sp.]|nr:50S ribosomal protein L11 methyltransferase [Desulfosarcina sp.]